MLSSPKCHPQFHSRGRCPHLLKPSAVALGEKRGTLIKLVIVYVCNIFCTANKSNEKTKINNDPTDKFCVCSQSLIYCSSLVLFHWGSIFVQNYLKYFDEPHFVTGRHVCSLLWTLQFILSQSCTVWCHQMCINLQPKSPKQIHYLLLLEWLLREKKYSTNLD